MATPTLERIGELLAGIGGRGTFASRRTAGTDNLRIEVTGVGPLRLPVSVAQARQLCRVARPARYGRGERTLLDARVRDTWEVPKSRVKIDRRRWNLTLLPVIEKVRRDLGLPDGRRITADFHNMLVYAPGQFFLPHQDSEKEDEMVGTLVVTLPSQFKGGTFVIEHLGERTTYDASRHALTFVAFYADCQHEVRPVKQGYRIVLSYNLILESHAAPAGSVPANIAVPTGSSGADGATVDQLADSLREHFETPGPPPRRAVGVAPRDPPRRLVYLLDHQYTERGVAWDRLKGADAARVATLRAAAERAGCDVVLALAEVHETWSCEEEDWDEPRYGGSRDWDSDEDDDDSYTDDDPPTDDPDDYTLGELQDSSVTLHRWIGPDGKKAEAIHTSVRDAEVLSSTPSSAFKPYASEYEGFMGNYGNTMDRWYRRGAVVIWPRERAFANRAEASPAWAMTSLAQRIRAGSVAEARKSARSLLPFWGTAALREERGTFFGKVLAVAAGLDSAELAAALLAPFRVEALTPRHAPALAELVDRYGEAWTRALLAKWSNPANDSYVGVDNTERLGWLASLARLSEALCEGAEAGTSAARFLLQDQWDWLKGSIDEARRFTAPGHRVKALTELAKPVLALLEGSMFALASDLRHATITFLAAEDDDRLLPCLMTILRTAGKSVAPAMEDAFSIEVIRQRCVALLKARLAAPPRAENDWSIEMPQQCRCELCAKLTTFLSSPGSTQFEWPLAKERRRHVHMMLDAHELPVRHETRRSGSPHKLMLTKTTVLFEREAAERRAWQADLDWLGGKYDQD